MTETKSSEFGEFRFEIVSDFDIRISGFPRESRGGG